MRILLFDIDGTLLLTGGVGTRAFAEAFRQQYRSEPDMTCYSPWGNTDYEIARSLLAYHFPDREIEVAEVEALLGTYLGLFGASLPDDSGFRLMPAALRCIEVFAEQPDTLVGVATGNLSRAADLKLRRGGLHHWIRFGGYAEDGVERADILRAAQRRALDIAGRGDHSWWVIGDTPKDIHAARAIGARVAAVATGKFGRDDLGKLGPDLLLEDLTSLCAEPGLLD